MGADETKITKVARAAIVGRAKVVAAGEPERVFVRRRRVGAHELHADRARDRSDVPNQHIVGDGGVEHAVVNSERLDDVGHGGLEEAEKRARAPETDTRIGGAAVQNARDGVEHNGDDDLGVANQIELEIASGDLLDANGGAVGQIEIVAIDTKVTNGTVGAFEQSGRFRSVGVPADDGLVF